jgi:oligopeptidase B
MNDTPSGNPLSVPPLASRRPTVLEAHGDRRVDEYHWLREKTNPEVIQYLEAENAYIKAQLDSDGAATTALYAEMLARIKETDDSVPAREGPYFYYVRTVQGLQYPIHCRKRGGLDAPEEVFLDENELAKGHKFFDLGAFEPSPSHRRIAYSTDVVGDEKFVIRVKDLATGEHFPEAIPETSGSIAFADEDTFFYTLLDETHRPYRVMRHKIGDDPARDVEVFKDDDERYFVAAGRSRSGDYVFVESGSKVSTEVWFVATATPDAPLTCVEPRREKIEYSIEHSRDRFLIVTNEDAVNFRLMETKVATPHRASWREVTPHRPDVHLRAVDAFRDHLVISERRGGVMRLRVQQIATGQEHEIETPEPVYSLRLGENLEYDTAEVRFVYSSLITPNSTFDYDMNTRARVLKKEQPVLGGYDRTRYASERLYATADDGAKVPISIVYRKDFPRDGTGALVLWGYGSYGLCYDPAFGSDRLSLLDRGIAVAIAHPRGGGEMGRTWYDAAKWLTKRRTFSDFIACAETLIRERYTASDRLAITGGSAGGMLIGNVLNERPELFHAALAQVPFVDVLTSMLDDSLPLTVAEYEEWGDPKQPEYYAYMKGYSPVDNVKPQRYPHLLVTAGLNDPRVQYWEPAKWVAKLRTLKQGDSLLLLKTNMGAGHQGASGRYEFLKERAFEYVFLLYCLTVR